MNDLTRRSATQPTLGSSLLADFDPSDEGAGASDGRKETPRSDCEHGLAAGMTEFEAECRALAARQVRGSGIIVREPNVSGRTLPATLPIRHATATSSPGRFCGQGSLISQTWASRLNC